MNKDAIYATRTNTIRQALALLDESAVGVLLLVDGAGKFERTITDGDLRRLLLAGNSLESLLDILPPAQSIVIGPQHTRREALELMQAHVINHIPVVDHERNIVGIVERAKIDDKILLSTPHMGASEIDFVNQAFSTNWIAPLGPNVDAFENELADTVGAKHAVALSSGTAAIHLALRLLDVGPGDQVFCSTLTFIASVSPILYQGGEPVLIDSEPNSWNMSPIALERAIQHARASGKLPKAVIVVALYGQSADMDPIMDICNTYGIPVIEDAAESLGAFYKGRPSGTIGTMGIYSFNGNKIITTSGGGMLLTPDGDAAAKARFLATQARDPAPHYQHSTIGYNYRMSNILAGVGRGQLKVLPERVAARRRIYDLYKRELAAIDWIEWMPEPSWSYSTHWLTAFTICEDRHDLTATSVINKLYDELIEARPVWKPMHMQPVFSECAYIPHDNNSVSTSIFERGVCLPSGSNLTDDQIARVVDVLRSIN